mmetsp:Transcript_13499/g.21346  ORF Transcript_13499/g.21346 Transcript_13499/m.21346 type:complete len:116 (-) Transcript_13499:114-461(-)
MEHFANPGGLDLEVRLCELVRQVVGLPSVGVSDNFFELGGTSIDAIRLSELVQRELGIQLPLKAIIENKTVEGFSLWMVNVACESTAKQDSCCLSLQRNRIMHVSELSEKYNTFT